MFSALKEYLYTQYQQLRNAPCRGKQRMDCFGKIQMHVCNWDLESGVYTYLYLSILGDKLHWLLWQIVTREKAFSSRL